MKIKYGKGTTKYGTGVDIKLSGNEVAKAIYLYLYAQGVHIQGAATIRANGKLLKKHRIYVDPAGSVIANGKLYDGKGKLETEMKKLSNPCDNCHQLGSEYCASACEENKKI